MLKKLNKLILVLVALLTFTGCTASYSLSSEISIENDFSGFVSFGFEIDSESVADPYTLTSVEETLVPMLKDSNRFTNELEVYKTKSNLSISYEESFTDLASLSAILSRISGETIALKYEETETSITKKESITGFLDDDSYLDWIFDTIEAGLLFGENSSDLRDNGMGYTTIYWDDEYFYGYDVTRETTPTLKGYEKHTTVFTDGASSHELILDFKDEKIVDEYIRLLTEDLNTEYRDMFTITSNGSKVTVNFEKSKWPYLYGNEYMFGFQVAINPMTVEDMSEYAEESEITNFKKSVKKHSIDDLVIFDIWEPYSRFQMTDDAYEVNTFTFDGYEIVKAIDIYLEDIDADIKGNTLTLSDDDFYLSIVAKEKTSFFAKAGSWIPVGIALLVAVVLIGFIIIKAKKSKNTKDTDESDNSNDSHDSNDSNNSNTPSSTTESDVTDNLEDTSTLTEPSLHDDTEANTSDSLALSDETQSIDEIVVSEDDPQDQIEISDTEIIEPFRIKSVLQSLKSNTIDVLKAFAKPETYLMLGVTLIIMVAVMSLVNIISLYGLKNLEYMGMSLESIYGSDVDLFSQAPNLLYQFLMIFTSSFTATTEYLTFTITFTQVLSLGLMIWSGLFVSRLASKLIFKKQAHKSSSYAVMTLILIGTVIGACFDYTVNGELLKFAIPTIFTRALPVTLIVSYLSVEKKSDAMKRLITKILFVSVLSLIPLIIGFGSNFNLIFIWIAFPNLILLLLGLFPFGIIQTTVSSGLFSAGYSTTLTMFHLIFASLGGFLAFIVLIIAMILAFMDLRESKKRFPNLSNSMYALVVSIVMSISIAVLTNIGSIKFITDYFSISFGAPIYSVILLFMFIYMISMFVLVIFKTEKDLPRSSVTRLLDKAIVTIQNVIFK